MLTNLVPHLDAKWDVQKGASVGWSHVYYLRFISLLFQNKWEIRSWPKAYWNWSSSAKFGLTPNSFLFSFCSVSALGKQPTESLKHGSGNRDVCALPVSDPEPLWNFGWVTVFLWFIFPNSKTSTSSHILLGYSKNYLSKKKKKVWDAIGTVLEVRDCIGHLKK